MAVSMAHSKGLLRTVWKQLSSTLVLVVLGSIAVWGHITHWQIGGHAHVADGAHDEATADSHAPASPGGEHATPPAAAAPSAPAETAPAAAAASPAAPARVKFDSAEGVRRAGIQTLAVKEQTLDEYVEGVGVVGYDQTKRAQLSCRVTGVVWRVEVYLGEPVKKDAVLAIIDSSEVGPLKAERLQSLAQVEVRTQIRNSLD